MFKEVVLLSLVTASVSFTISETKLFEPLRRWVKKIHLGELLSCGYCLGHWVAFVLVSIYRPRLFDMWWPLDYFITALVIAWLSGVQWVIMCFIMDKAKK
jgi:hypothetical protein